MSNRELLGLLGDESSISMTHGDLPVPVAFWCTSFFALTLFFSRRIACKELPSGSGRPEGNWRCKQGLGGSWPGQGARTAILCELFFFFRLMIHLHEPEGSLHCFSPSVYSFT